MRDIIDYFRLVFIFFGALAINALFLPDYGFNKSDLGFLDGLIIIISLLVSGYLVMTSWYGIQDWSSDNSRERKVTIIKTSIYILLIIFSL